MGLDIIVHIVTSVQTSKIFLLFKDNCGHSAGRGKCLLKAGAYKCVCNRGFVGDDCSLDEEVRDSIPLSFV